MPLATGVTVGLVAWFATGVDDFLVVLTFMRIRRSKLNTLAVVVGTVLSVLLMIIVCLLLNQAATALVEWGGNLRLAGLVPITLGTIGLLRTLRGVKRGTSRWNRWMEASGIGAGALLAYLSNSTDDIIVNTSVLQSPFLMTGDPGWYGFLLGIVMGSLVTCGIAYLLLQLGDAAGRRFAENKPFRRVARLLPVFVDISIIIVGLLILLDMLPAVD